MINDDQSNIQKFVHKHHKKLGAALIVIGSIGAGLYSYTTDREESDLKVFNCIQLDFKDGVGHPKHVEMTVTTNKKSRERLLATPDGRKQLIEENAPFDFNYEDIETIYLLPDVCDASPLYQPVN
ncbi:hypothetical protein ACTXIV_02880 [Psychrobacter celer]|uniref:hypothetical protein n=1 Tax=Psychrobacter celer TaxID=306572 RepID=UPI003FCF9C1E